MCLVTAALIERALLLCEEAARAGARARLTRDRIISLAALRLAAAVILKLNKNTLIFTVLCRNFGVEIHTNVDAAV